MSQCPICHTKYVKERDKNCSNCGWDLAPYPMILATPPDVYASKLRQDLNWSKEIWTKFQAQALLTQKKSEEIDSEKNQLRNQIVEAELQKQIREIQRQRDYFSTSIKQVQSQIEQEKIQFQTEIKHINRDIEDIAEQKRKQLRSACLRSLVVASGDKKETDFHFTRPVSRAISRLTTKAMSFSPQITRMPTFISHKRLKSWHWGLIVAGILLLLGTISFSPSLSTQEKNQQKEIYRRVKALDLDTSAFYSQVNIIFYQKYPRLQGIKLTHSAEDQPYRQVWYEIADKLLDRHEQER